jgi:5-methylcytosine-specific restriction enzyme A
MLARQRELIAKELLEGTGAGISVRLVAGELRQGVRIWFSELGEKHGPVAEILPHGLKSHAVRLSFGPFSGGILATIRNAGLEEVELARALFRSIPQRMNLEITGQDLSSWSVSNGGFEARALIRHDFHKPGSEEAIIATCREVVVPMMAAMAELIGYDPVEESGPIGLGEIEGVLSWKVVSRRERNLRNRLLCMRIHGHACAICFVDPRAVYGDAGNVIEIHHLLPLALLSAPRQYDPETDLVPLCPCCHRAVHTRRPVPYSPEELSGMMGRKHG